MSTDPPPLPDRSEWAQFEISDTVELHAGKQSRVFRAELDGIDVAVKLTDGRLTDRALLQTRTALAEALAVEVAAVVRPQRIAGALVQPIGDWLMTATPFVTGDAVDLARPGTSELLGRTLAQLHGAMALMPAQALPPVAALSAVVSDADRSDWQLLHGDFNEQNMIDMPDGLIVFDFDDSGYGPIAFDVANTLYMVLFDADVHGRPKRYDAFRTAFLDGYAVGSGEQLDDDVIDEWIAVRVSALGRWLDDLTTAPIGIRTASTEWHEVLRTFVRSRQPPHD